MRNRNIPFGYQYRNGVLAVHPQESQTVRAVFAAYLSGEPLSKIAANLTAKLVEYLPGHSQWDKARVKRLLDNVKYTGEGLPPAHHRETVPDGPPEKRKRQHQPAACGRGHQDVQGPDPLPSLRRDHDAAHGQPIREFRLLEMSSL